MMIDLSAGLRLVQAANAVLGEGPLWCAQEGALYWIDISRPALYRYTPDVGQTGAWALPEKVGCIADLGLGRLLLALQSGLSILSVRDGSLTPLTAANHAVDGMRFNDGAVDQRGRFWVGSMGEGGSAIGKLYRLDSATQLTEVSAGWTTPNGIGWSPDGATMYVTDSALRTIWQYDYSLEDGVMGARRVFAQFDNGVPDGLAVDAEGQVWTALWDGWRIVRINPQGKITHTLAMPVQRVTSMAFGGADLRTLYITSAAINVGNAGLQAGPLAGALFALEAPAAGLPVSKAHFERIGEAL